MPIKRAFYRESDELHLIAEMQVPLRIIREHRKSVRTSIGKDTVYLRIPYWTSEKQEHHLRQWCLNWLEKRHEKSGVLSKLQRSHIVDGHQIRTAYASFIVRIDYAERKTAKGRVNNDELQITVPIGMSSSDEQDMLRKVINKLLGSRFQSILAQRVHAMNDSFFQRRIESVQLRWNYSKWGSCSSTGKITLSTRLIFAPQPVIDYVIVHELAHLIELNHSPKFWNIVSNLMPDYKKHEEWLRNNAWKCDY